MELENRALKVRDEDFEECELIEIEGSVFSEWLDKLRDNDQVVAIDLKTWCGRNSHFCTKIIK